MVNQINTSIAFKFLDLTPEFVNSGALSPHIYGSTRRLNQRVVLETRAGEGLFYQKKGLYCLSFCLAISHWINEVSQRDVKITKCQQCVGARQRGAWSNYRRKEGEVARKVDTRLPCIARPLLSIKSYGVQKTTAQLCVFCSEKKRIRRNAR